MKFSINFFCSFLLCSVVSFASAEKLKNDAPEFKQLEAMGYDLDTSNKDLKGISVFTNGDSLINIDKNEGRVAVWRSFSRKKLDSTKEYQLLKIINKINNDTTFQVSLYENGISYTIFLYGPYNSRAVSSTIRMLEKINFDADLMKLLNNE